MKRTYCEIFNELSSLTDTELSRRYKRLWFDINVRSVFLDDSTGYSMDEDVLMHDIICARFCQQSGVPTEVICNVNSLYYSWCEDGDQ